MEVMIFYVPCKDEASASALVDALLKEKMIACGNVFSSLSMYNWEGAFCKEGESVAFMKTLPELETKLEKRINELHTYELPCIARWSVKTNEAYAEWVKKQVS